MDKGNDKKRDLVPSGRQYLINASPLIGRGLELARNISNLAKYKARILLVDDDPDILDVFDLVLSEFYDLGKSLNGAEALEELKRNHYDLIITDIPMPIMDGLELIKRVNEWKPGLPSMILTGQTKWIAGAVELGCLAYFQKPFEPSQLLATLALILSKEYRANKHKIIIQLVESSSLVNDGTNLSVEVSNEKEADQCKAKIIWVDHEEDRLRFGERFLTPKGYKVVTFTRSLDAIEELKKNEYDLLLATVVMPVMEGPDLAYVAAEIRPKIKTILFFGGITPEEEWEKMNKDSSIVALLSYPLVKDRILTTIEKALKINEKG